MTLRYTTLDAINARLDGRLKIGGNSATFGETVVLPELALQIGEQIEDLIDTILASRYILPLKNTHPFIGQIAELGVVCQLLSQYYLGQQPSSEAPSDPAVCADYKRMLKMLYKLTLEGESLKTPDQQPQSLVWGFSFAGDRDDPSTVVQW